jgi:heme-degrading monooxygenase HmoA/ketosteroid isomerase-like protein
MSDRRLIVFRSRLRPGVEDAYNSHAGRIYDLATRMPGFIAAKDFSADDGERVALIEWSAPRELSVWRDYPEHTEAQAMGRDTYYADYDLRVCSELRVSRFEAATGKVERTDSDPAKLRGIAERWLACLGRQDVDGMVELYADDSTHWAPRLSQSPLVGREALRAWWNDTFKKWPSLGYELLSITADASRVAVAFTRKIAGEPDIEIAHIFEIADGKIASSRVFYG